ncbi:unnamed protein product [Pleuronectes platessa]|uniref:Uncharacterized protein n=1 Tax=Pleuronectes platessa TaxID=8262 RepID=A0A9N7YS30_PLEPL|nr:unnamed protein product [Pleuronectes platessa]
MGGGADTAAPAALRVRACVYLLRGKRCRHWSLLSRVETRPAPSTRLRSAHHNSLDFRFEATREVLRYLNKTTVLVS